MEISTIILIIAHIVISYLAYKNMQMAHSKGGIYYGLHLDESDLIFTFVPFLNWVMALKYIAGAYEDDVDYTNYSGKKMTRLDKFYRIKR